MPSRAQACPDVDCREPSLGRTQGPVHPRDTTHSQQVNGAALKERFVTALFRSRVLLRRRGYEIIRAPDGSASSLHLWTLFNALRINVLLDVGAREGEFGLGMRRNGYDGWILSFEPVRASFEVLAARAASEERWLAFNYALGSQSGSADINVTDLTFFSSFLDPSAYATETFGAAPSVRSTETVDVKRLDDIFDSLLGEIADPSVFLKLDTQGWDLEVMRGAARSLARIEALQTEISAQPVYDGMPTMRESLDHLDAIGYEIFNLYAINTDAQLRAVEFDCVAVRVRDRAPAA